MDRRSTSTRRRCKGYPDVPRDQRRPFYNKFGWTQGIDYFCNCATNRYDSLQTRLTKRFSSGYSAQANYTLQRARTHDGQYFETDLPEHQGLYDSSLNYGPPDWDRVHNFSTSIVAELPFGHGRRYACGRVDGGRCVRRRLAVQHERDHPERSAVQRQLSRQWSGSRYRTEPAGSDRRSRRPPDAGTSGSTRRRSAHPNSAFGRPAKGTFGNLPRNALRGPGYWRADASLFKHFTVHQSGSIEIRLEMVNFLNHVNLGNPDSEVGVPGNPNTNAGRINSTAFGNADPQRQFQFGLKYKF